MRPVRVEVNDKMQKGYVYFRTKPMGRAFRPGFTPELTPKQMFDLGVFGGKYMTDCRKEFPASWFKRAKLLPNWARASLNYFGVNASQPLPEWRSKGWIHPEDPRGCFQWYCRFYLASKAKSRFPSDNERLRISLNACKCSDYGSDLMSSLTKDTHDPPKSPFWIACFNGIGSDGRVQRFKRSTKTTDRKLAQRMADEWEEGAKLAGQGRLTEHHCRRVLSEIYEKAVGEPLHFRSCRAWLTEWLENAKANVTRDTWFRYDRGTECGDDKSKPRNSENAVSGGAFAGLRRGQYRRRREAAQE
jgi:hypothetical protein